MWERTLTVGSAGKTFSLTGWKCGWIYGPENLLYNVKVAHQNNIYTYCTPIQVPFLNAIRKGENISAKRIEVSSISGSLG